MAELNAAYDKVRTVDRARSTTASSAPGGGGIAFKDGACTGRGGQAVRSEHAGRPLDFGRYEGLTVTQIARRDMDYLRWLSRHASGARFRAEIEAEIRARAPAKPKA